MKKRIQDHPLLAVAALLTVVTALALGGCQFQGICESCATVEYVHPQPLLGQAMITSLAARTVAVRRDTGGQYHVTVKMDRSGGLRTLTVGSIEGLHKGAKVRIVEGRVIPASA